MSITLRHTALPLQALMEAICGLSYTGDIRMRWGEDKRKIQRIVQGSYPALTKMFLPHLQVCTSSKGDMVGGHTLRQTQWLLDLSVCSNSYGKTTGSVSPDLTCMFGRGVLWAEGPSVVGHICDRPGMIRDVMSSNLNFLWVGNGVRAHN